MNAGSPSVAARDAYLAWQAEIGTEDVVLTVPWTRRAPAVRSGQPARPDAHDVHDARTHAPADAAGAPPATPGAPSDAHLPPVNFEPMKPFAVPGMPGAGPEFFSAIAEQLAQAERASARKPGGPVKAAAATGTVAAVPAGFAALQAAKDLDAYWTILEAEYPGWFPDAPRGLSRAEGHAAPRLAVVELMPLAAEGGDAGAAKTALPFAGANGALLDRMMTAIGLTRDQLYLTSLMKSPPPPGKRWARKDTARMVPVLTRELQLAQCGLVLVMGEACAQAILKTGRAIPELVKSPVETDGLSFSATWHPEEIRSGDAAVAATGAKAARPRATQAWDHLQWLRGLLPRV